MANLEMLETKIEALIDKATKTDDASDAMKFAQAATNAGQALCMLRDLGREASPKLDIDEMVDRFLSWKLPASFSPDAGISFKPIYNEGTPYQGRHEPTGTNLLDATQAKAMVLHLLG
jgi:hypothetical protein